MAISRALRPASRICTALALLLVACRPAGSASAPAPATPASGATAAATQPTAVLAGLDPPSAAKDDPAGAGEAYGALDKDDIRKVVRAGVVNVRACYNAGLDIDPKLTGRVAIQFVIAGDGTVAQTTVQDSTLPAWARSVADCIATVAGRWQFPPPEGGGNVTVLYPFVLVPN